MPSKKNNQEKILIEDEIKNSYLDYAMSVIIGRAIPEVRDGLKPVHRRILFAMYEIHNDFDKKYKKSARIVGNVIGKYHPHGDSAVYDSLVRLAQKFAMRYPLIDGQGNFGSIDGDSPAAMRYTEVRMNKITHEYLSDIDKKTVIFTENYDNSALEPIVLPSKVPGLLINGSSGIAVGMATNIPPHNLGEICQAVIALIDNPKTNLETILKYIPGPDFPTGALILGHQGIKDAYQSGKGTLCLRSKSNIENLNNRNYIIIKELPYQINKTRLLEQIAELIKNKKINGISNIRDESDRDGLRIVFKISKAFQPQVVLNQLFKFSQLQTNFNINILAIVNKEPQVLSLVKILKLFIEHRCIIVEKRIEFDLKKAKNKLHILEGLKISLNNLDEMIALIKNTNTPTNAKQSIIDTFNLTEKQTIAILNLKLQKLTNLERTNILKEHQYLTSQINKLEKIIKSPQEIISIVRAETSELALKYKSNRRTKIITDNSEIKTEDMIPKEEMVVTISHTGYIKRSPIDLYRSQRRGGKGVRGMTPKEKDFIEKVFIASTHSYLLVFTTKGRLYWIKVHLLPQYNRAARGKAIVNLLKFEQKERIATILSINEFCENHQIIMATQKGLIKKTNLATFSRPRVGGIIAININKKDKLVSVRLSNNNMEIILATKQGQAIRFHEKEVRSMGRNAAGVKGINLKKDDSVVAMETVKTSSTLLTITENGYGKRTKIDEYPLRRRGGKGVITIRTNERNGPVVGALLVNEKNEVMIISDQGKIIRINISDIRIIKRNTQGVKLINLDSVERLVSVALISKRKKESKK